MIEINIDDKRWLEYLDSQFIVESLNIIDAIHDCTISIMMTNDNLICKLNLDYRNINKPTNVLSFPYNSDFAEHFIGDIAISFDTVMKEAHEKDISIKQHVVHLLIHGALHLLGYTHGEDKNARIMEEKESDLLSKLGFPNPYIN